jgi:hypothetical protein
MKLGGLKNTNLSIELNEEELAVIIEGLEVVGDLKLMSDVDTIMFQYFKVMNEGNRVNYQSEL